MYLLHLMLVIAADEHLHWKEPIHPRDSVGYLPALDAVNPHVHKIKNQWVSVWYKVDKTKNKIVDFKFYGVGDLCADKYGLQDREVAEESRAT